MAHIVFTSRQSRGFTLVELLVVTLILSILMAIALPLYISAVADSRKKTNRTNMQSIATAVQTAYTVGQKTDYSSFAGDISSAKEPDLQTLPIGPRGETYSITVPGASGGPFMVTCSDPDAGTFELGHDHN